jgi:regulator of protease activity HflC (stomatin/prohibitin superfamily)
MKKLLLLLLALIPFTTGCACTTIDRGHVGVVVHMYGEDRGVDGVTVKTGRIWYNPMTTKVYEYATFTQRPQWTADTADDGKNAEVTFNSIEGAKITSDVTLHYKIRANRVPNVFVNRRGDSAEVSEYLRGKTRDAVNTLASKMHVSDIYGAGKEKLLADAKAKLEADIGEDYEFEMLAFVGAMRVPPSIEQSINLTIEAQQQAIAAENKIKQTEAEAQQKIAKAKGDGDSLLIEANKQAEANITLAKSLTPELVNWRALEKWDGKLPQVNGGGATPFINVNK